MGGEKYLSVYGLLGAYEAHHEAEQLRGGSQGRPLGLTWTVVLKATFSLCSHDPKPKCQFLGEASNSSTLRAFSSGNVTQSTRNSDSNIASSNKIISNYIRSRDLESALRVFNNMPFKSTVTWNSILSLYSRKRGKLDDAQQVFDKIPEPDAFSYNIMLFSYIANAVVESAKSFFDRIPFKDIALWNTMISGFARRGRMGEARELFELMPQKNGVSWSVMISGYVESGELYLVVELFEAASIKSVVAWTAMINGFMKSGRIHSAERLFKETPKKNLVTWNAIIAGYVENGRAENGLKLVKTMLGFRIQPNASTLSSVLLGCSQLSVLQLDRQILQFVSKSPLSNDTTTCTSLISMYCKCRELDDAWKLFSEIPSKDER
ncbi:pentatricopeptide repeat-containing protein At4g16835, mitochondrial-like [Rutidosis leptorrhynchoides]|uniref:pentatricopeptide repeat-containing protein At4g16835, mitochondrial-like n=1 Tax=Rutidosis leptorrhynchoides TaxID=125765 RepID=UPI003A990178